MLKSKGVRCAICNSSKIVYNNPDKVCLNCYFAYSDKIPRHIPLEQHDFWIINHYKKEQKGKA